MKERPILFSGPMVRAIRDGIKTQTRRVISHFDNSTYALDPAWVAEWKSAEGKWWAYPTEGGSSCLPLFGTKCPYGQLGDRLWVRETFARCHPGELQHLDPEPDDPHWFVLYRADGVTDSYIADYGEQWRPSIFMPRWASRITLEIVSVRVERVQEIGRDGRKAKDVLAEGITDSQIEHWRKWLHPDDAPAHTYGVLWDSINAKRGYGWAKNPWVWVIEFKRIEKGSGV